MNHLKTENSSSSVVLLADELSKPSQEDTLKLKRLTTSLATAKPPRTSREKVIIRSGKVRMKGYGIVNGMWRSRWLELREQSLSICRRKGSARRTIIYGQDIATIERTILKPHCLFLEVKGKIYWFSFDDDEELYEWLDDMNHRWHPNHITTPKNFVHHVHVSYDYIAGRFQGLPIQWQNILDESDGCLEEAETSSGVALPNARIIGPKFVLRRPPSLHPAPRLDSVY